MPQYWLPFQLFVKRHFNKHLTIQESVKPVQGGNVN